MFGSISTAYSAKQVAPKFNESGRYESNGVMTSFAHIESSIETANYYGKTPYLFLRCEISPYGTSPFPTLTIGVEWHRFIEKNSRRVKGGINFIGGMFDQEPYIPVSLRVLGTSVLLGSNGTGQYSDPQEILSKLLNSDRFLISATAYSSSIYVAEFDLKNFRNQAKEVIADCDV